MTFVYNANQMQAFYQSASFQLNERLVHTSEMVFAEKIISFCKNRKTSLLHAEKALKQGIEYEIFSKKRHDNVKISHDNATIAGDNVRLSRANVRISRANVTLSRAMSFYLVLMSH